MVRKCGIEAAGRLALPGSLLKSMLLTCNLCYREEGCLMGLFLSV